MDLCFDYAEATQINMRSVLLFSAVSVLFTVGSALFLNPNHEVESFIHDGHPGKASFLSKYIENGDVEIVSIFVDSDVSNTTNDET